MQITRISKTLLLIDNDIVKAIVKKHYGWIVKKDKKTRKIQVSVQIPRIKKLYRQYIVEHKPLDYFT